MAADIIKFTRAALSAIEPAPRRIYFRDTDSRGLLLVVMPTGTKSFELYRKVNGSPKRTALGRFDPSLPETRDLPAGVDPISLIGNSPALNVRMARRIAAALNEKLDQGSDPVQAKKEARKAAAAELSLEQGFDLYFERHLKAEGKRTAEATRGDFNRYLGNVPPGQKKAHGTERKKAPGSADWSKRKLSSIKTEEITKLMNDLSAQTGARTANITLSILRACYRWLIAKGHCHCGDPTHGIKKIKAGEVKRDRFLKGDELPRFFEALGREQSRDFRDFVLLALLTGARSENVRGMRWQDIDFTSAMWVIPAKFSKNSHALTLPLTAMALDVLRDRKAAGAATSPYVFAANSASGYITVPRKRWVNLLADAGLSDLRMHDLRRSLGSWQAMTGASLAIVGASLGHKSLQATQIYARLQVDPVREAMERAQASMMGPWAHGSRSDMERAVLDTTNDDKSN
jgi:integrase